VTGFDAAEQVGALGDGQLEVDPRVELAEVAQDPRQRGEGQVVGHPEPQPAAQLRAGEVPGRLLVRGQDGPGEPGHRFAVRGQRHRPGVPHEQRSPDRHLEFADMLTHRRLPDAQPLGRLGEAERLRHRQERPELVRVVHRCTSHYATQ
jgi:hypothetical protein